jgi:glutaredoxin 3
MAHKIDVERLPRGAQLELYVSPSCPYCVKAKAFYDAAGVAYVTHDAQNDREAREKMFGYTNGDPTVPAIVVDGRYVQSGWGTPPRG